MEFPDALHPMPIPYDDKQTTSDELEGDAFQWFGNPGYMDVTDDSMTHLQMTYPDSSKSMRFVADAPTLPLGDPEPLLYPFYDVCLEDKGARIKSLHDCLMKLKPLKGSLKRYPLTIRCLPRVKSILTYCLEARSEPDFDGLIRKFPAFFSYFSNFLKNNFESLFEKHKQVRRLNRLFSGGCLSVVRSLDDESSNLLSNDHQLEQDAFHFLDPPSSSRNCFGEVSSSSLIAYSCGSNLSRLNVASVSFDDHSVNCLWEREYQRTIYQTNFRRYYSENYVLLRTGSGLEVVRLPALHSSKTTKDGDDEYSARSVRLDQSNVYCTSLNSFYSGEAAFAGESCVKLWNYEVESAPTVCHWFEEEGHELRYKQVFYGSQPKHLFAAYSSSLQLLDLRTKGRQPLTVFSSPSALAASSSRIVAAAGLESNPHLQVVTMEKAAFLVDDRFAKYTALAWSIPSVSSPIYCKTCPQANTEVVAIGTQDNPEVFCASLTTPANEAVAMTEPLWRVCPFKDFVKLNDLEPIDSDICETRVDMALVGVGICPRKNGFSVLQLSACGDLFQQTYEHKEKCLTDDKTHSRGPRGMRSNSDESSSSSVKVAAAWCEKLVSQVDPADLPQEEVPVEDNTQTSTLLGRRWNLAGPPGSLGCELCTGPVFTSTQPSQSQYNSLGMGEPSQSQCNSLGMSLSDVESETASAAECPKCGCTEAESHSIIRAAQRNGIVRLKPDLSVIEKLNNPDSDSEDGGEGDTVGCCRIDKDNDVKNHEDTNVEPFAEAEGQVLLSLWNGDDPTDALLKRDNLWVQSKLGPSSTPSLSDAAENSGP